MRCRQCPHTSDSSPSRGSSEEYSLRVDGVVIRRYTGELARNIIKRYRMDGNKSAEYNGLHCTQFTLGPAERHGSSDRIPMLLVPDVHPPCLTRALRPYSMYCPSLAYCFFPHLNPPSSSVEYDSQRAQSCAIGSFETFQRVLYSIER